MTPFRCFFFLFSFPFCLWWNYMNVSFPSTFLPHLFIFFHIKEVDDLSFPFLSFNFLSFPTVSFPFVFSPLFSFNFLSLPFLSWTDLFPVSRWMNGSFPPTSPSCLPPFQLPLILFSQWSAVMQVTAPTSNVDLHFDGLCTRSLSLPSPPSSFTIVRAAAGSDTQGDFYGKMNGRGVKVCPLPSLYWLRSQLLPVRRGERWKVMEGLGELALVSSSCIRAWFLFLGLWCARLSESV